MRTFSFCGTIEYMSPELIKGGIEGHDFSVDWWSVGVLTYELLTGASPFTVDGERNTQAEISKRILRNQPPIPEHLSAQARDFIRRLLVKEPSKRLGGRQGDASQLKSHPFLSSIDWNLLAQRKLKAPFKPKVKHELDVSNFAEEFTSMAPHVLVCSSNNQINSASIIDDGDDYFDSDEDDDENDANQIGSDNIEDNGDEDNNEVSCANNDIDNHFGGSGGGDRDSNDFYEKNSARSGNDILNQKAFLSSLPQTSLTLTTDGRSSFGNYTVIKSKKDASTNDDNSTSMSNGEGHPQQVFSILTPSKHQLSFSLLARQHQEQQQLYVSQNSINSSNNSLGLANSNDNNVGRMPVTGRNDLGKHLQTQSTTINNNQAHQQQQYYNGIHFSKLFKGYSYINPKAVEWFKQKERRSLSEFNSKSFNTIRDDRKISNLANNYRPATLLKNFPSYNEFNDDQAFKQNLPFINEQNELDDVNGESNFPTRGAKALPIEDVLTYDSQLSCYSDRNNDIYDDKKLSIKTKTMEQQSKNEHNLRVAFTIGDGEDLYAAVRSAGIAASKQTPERLVVAKRKPSLELLYERHANHQILAPTANIFSSSRVTKTTLPLSTNPNISTTTTLKLDQRSKMQKNTNNIRPKVGSILFDPQCDFFKIYHLVNPINSKRDLLGEGAFSICKRCVHKETGKEYAVKIMNSSLETSREIEMLRRCQDHPNVVKLYDVFQDSYNSYMVFELLKGGELLSRIRGKRRHQVMNERDVCRIFRSLVSTVDYLHSQRIVHRDLKPENLLFVDSTPSSELKLIDFGFARELPELDSGDTMQSPCITLDYCAPEVLKQAFPVSRNKSNKEINVIKLDSSSLEAGYDESCDLWSMGVILYAMLSGRLPFNKDQLTPTEPLAPTNVGNIRSRTVDFTGPEWVRISQAPKDIIKGLLNPDPTKRLTIQNLVHNDWLMNFDSTEPIRRQAKGTKRKSPSEATKNNTQPITMTLRKRATLMVNSKKESETTGKVDKQQKLKRSLDNHEHQLNSNTLTSETQSSASKTKRPKLDTSNKTLPNEQLDSKWLSRFVQIDRANKDSLRITFRALNNHNDSVADSRNGFSLDSQRSNASYELADDTSSPSSSPTSMDFTIANGVVNTSSSNVTPIYTAVEGKRQVKRPRV